MSKTKTPKTNAELAELDAEALVTTATLGVVLGLGTEVAASLTTALIRERDGVDVLDQYNDWIKAGRPEGKSVDDVLTKAGFQRKKTD